MNSGDFRTLREFWPYYLNEHRHPVNRGMHFIGNSLVLIVLAAAVSLREWQLLFALPFLGYGFAWVGHFFFEKNRPATFSYPFKSFACDWIMYWYTLTGRIAGELKRYVSH